MAGCKKWPGAPAIPHTLADIAKKSAQPPKLQTRTGIRDTSQANQSTASQHPKAMRPSIVPDSGCHNKRWLHKNAAGASDRLAESGSLSRW